VKPGLSKEFLLQTKHVAWGDIIATRNRRIHGYASVELDVLWDIVQNDLPVLKKQVE
jgi:uncharacterized protein with HEPN domain